MLNPKQQAKLAVLRHVSSMMDQMMGSKLKKPAAMSVEVDAVHHSPSEPGMSQEPEEPKLPHESMGEEQPSSELSLGEPSEPKSPMDEELGDEDLHRLMDHYHSIK